MYVCMYGLLSLACGSDVVASSMEPGEIDGCGLMEATSWVVL